MHCSRTVTEYSTGATGRSAGGAGGAAAAQRLPTRCRSVTDAPPINSTNKFQRHAAFDVAGVIREGVLFACSPICCSASNSGQGERRPGLAAFYRWMKWRWSRSTGQLFCRWGPWSIQCNHCSSYEGRKLNKSLYEHSAWKSIDSLFKPINWVTCDGTLI